MDSATPTEGPRGAGVGAGQDSSPPTNPGVARAGCRVAAGGRSGVAPGAGARAPGTAGGAGSHDADDRIPGGGGGGGRSVAAVAPGGGCARRGAAAWKRVLPRAARLRAVRGANGGGLGPCAGYLFQTGGDGDEGVTCGSHGSHRGGGGGHAAAGHGVRGEGAHRFTQGHARGGGRRVGAAATGPRPGGGGRVQGFPGTRRWCEPGAVRQRAGLRPHHGGGAAAAEPAAPGAEAAAGVHARGAAEPAQGRQQPFQPAQDPGSGSEGAGGHGQALRAALGPAAGGDVAAAGGRQDGPGAGPEQRRALHDQQGVQRLQQQADAGSPPAVRRGDGRREDRRGSVPLGHDVGDRRQVAQGRDQARVPAGVPGAGGSGDAR